MGVEFASIFNSFGTQVTVLEMLPRVTPIEDEEISAELEKALKKKGIQIFTEAKVEIGEKRRAGRDGFVHGQGRKDADAFPPSAC